MKNKYSYLLIIIPVLLFIFSVSLRKTQGAYYLNTRYDPVYVYLINSLNLSQFAEVAHVDHPGTPVQVIGAIVIRLYYLVNGKSTDIAEDVLSNPESYLNAIFLSLAFINSTILFLTGISFFRSFKNIYIALLLQLSPFVAYTIFYEFSVINAENLLIPVIMILLALSFKFIRENTTVSKNEYYFVILFALICGLGIAVKITFTPLIIIPLILLKGINKKMLFLFFTFISFLLFVIPAISNYNYFFDWIKRLFINDGIYGTGKPVIIDSSSFIIHLKEILINEIIFTFTYILSLIFILLTYFKKNKIQYKHEYKFLIAIFCAMTFQIIIVSKHYSGHYMLPALVLIIPGIFTIISIIHRMYDNKKLKLNYIYLLLSIILFSSAFIEAAINLKISGEERDEAIKLNDFIEENYKDAVIISSYGSSSKEYALAFSTKWAGNQKARYQEILNKLYPGKLFFEFWDNKIYTFTNENNDNFINKKKIIIFQNKFEDSNENLIKNLKVNYNFSEYTLSKIFSSSNGEALYEIKLK